MSDQDEAFQWLTVTDAAAALGVSRTTALRRIKDGTLVAQKSARPQGARYFVRLPAGLKAPRVELPQIELERTTAQPEPAVTLHADAPLQDAFVAQIIRACTAIIEPLVTQIDALRQTIEQQATHRYNAEWEAMAAELVSLKIKMSRLEIASMRRARQAMAPSEGRERLVAELTPPGNA